MQTLTPTSAITNTAWTVTGSSAEAACADEDDSTYCTTSSATNELELKFTTPTQTPVASNSRFRMTLKGAGSVAVRFLEGSTELQAGSVFSLTAAFQEYSLTLTAAPSAWSDLRVEIVASASGIAVSRVVLDVGDGESDPTDRRDSILRTGRGFSRARFGRRNF